MYFSKSVIAAIMAFTLVQGTSIQPRCDECGGKGKLNSDERTVYVGPPGDAKRVFIFPSHEACTQGKLDKRFHRLVIPEYMLEDRCKPIKEFCRKCPTNEKFQPGGALFGKNPHTMMGEEIVRACGDHCGITYPEDDGNINVEGAKEVAEKTAGENTVEEEPFEQKPAEGKRQLKRKKQAKKRNQMKKRSLLEKKSLLKKRSQLNRILLGKRTRFKRSLFQKPVPEEPVQEEPAQEESALVQEEPVLEQPVQEEPAQEEPATVQEEPAQQEPVENVLKQNHSDADVSEGEQKGACSAEGMFNCISGSSFQQCASGSWSVVQNLAPGTVCTSGQSYGLGMRAAA
ncbi:predicted protein [Sclerotinia sclerotiorum 1980 UF-70]|uniref:Uncharacterized protein n=1 Tax=Sclerotinia sclerotiorum (strain ATCC 18683 / 1980 / Ss-1) TaxID=665079 RepID=A7EIW4_SCLS1|nr:predicted protein [Sclerotinia sclerotiorum 1980 UF-70]EDO02780.1 predicted protein [Sclerotinia sclerotiorum 1980 UF-70]